MPQSNEPIEDLKDAQQWEEEAYAPFWFDEHSLVPLEKLKAQGMRFDELEVRGPQGEQKTLIIPRHR